MPWAPGTAPHTSDLVVLPQATLTVEQGLATMGGASTGDVRMLQSPTGSTRRRRWYHATQLKLRLNFTPAYTGPPPLRLDWEQTARRMNVTVTDGTTTRTVQITTSLPRRRLDALPDQRAGGRHVEGDRR